MKYSEVAKTYQELENTTKKLEKTNILAKLLKKTGTQDLASVIILCLGRIFPLWDDRVIGVASNLMKKTVSTTAGEAEKTIEKMWVQKGDLGLVAEELAKNKKQQTLTTQTLTVQKVIENLQKITGITGKGAVDKKLSLISELLTSATPIEAKYIVRTALGELRMGVGEAQVRDAIIQAFFPTIVGHQLFCPRCKTIIPRNHKKCPLCQAELPVKKLEQEIKLVLDNVQKQKILMHKKWKHLKNQKNDFIMTDDFNLEKHDLRTINFIIPETREQAKKLQEKINKKVQTAYDKTIDFGEVALTVKEKGWKGLEETSLSVGRPIKVMLAERVADIKEAFKKIGVPAAFETKYDGFRMQLHKKGNEIKLFTRRMDDITEQFPEIAERFSKAVNEKEVILDAEVVGYDPKTNQPLPFQKISRRIKRKYDIQEMIREIPVRTFAFDIFQLNGKTLLKKRFEDRRKLLEKTVKPIKNEFELAEQKILSTEKQVQDFLNQKLGEGQEGLIGKKLDAPYQPGKRVGHMIKLKVEMETLDLIIVGAQWGEGKRSNWLSSFELACRSEQGELLAIGKMGTGLTDEQFKTMTKTLKSLIIGEQGKNVKVKPEIVVEVAYQEIQKSPTYSSGLALRFPRMVRFRETKSVEDADTLKRINKLYKQQKMVFG
ncbi:MAG: ATP-dependent DNA ligase [Nanoarchaeota archaeon]|nr:ATP-dependent DNA ligase [Nanoarchaeota archaeon]